MVSNQTSENGVDGDDEREEDDAEEEEEEVEEEEEEEPRLKYQRLGGSVPSLLSNDAAASIAVAERMIALGTHDGTVHILDFQGNQVKECTAHTATVNDISFDSEGEYVGSCSDDGTVVINGLFTDEKLKFEYHRPMKTIALDPDFSRKPSRRFVTGGLAGQLFLNMKNWFGYSKKILHDGEGPIHAVQWRTNLIAWANDAGVKIYDMANNQRITFIERPRGSPRPELLLPHLVWQADTLLVIGWGTSVKIAAIKTNQSSGANGLQRSLSITSTKYVDIVASFQTSYYISGIAPFGDNLVVLAYILEEENGEKDFSSGPPARQGTAQRPEVRIVSWKNDELTTDALPVHGYEHYKAKDYALAHVPFSGSSYSGGQWAAGDEPLYYIVSPKDVVIARPRDAEDHISWLLQHGWHEKALAAVEARQGQTELLDEVGSRYLDHLIVERKYAEAASLCSKILRGSASAWERWVFHFAHLRQLPVLVPYIPIENPQLNDTAYEVALVSLVANPSFHKLLLTTVKSWPSTLYSSTPVISAIEPQINTSSATDFLKEALAELYVINTQYEKALALYADLMKPEIFYFIEKHSLHDIIQDKVAELMLLDSKKAVNLLIQHRDLIPPSEIVERLFGTSRKCDKRHLVHVYLHALFEIDPQTGKDFHDLQVELYAEYEPKMLLLFLRSSQHYRLEKAYEICMKKELVREQVFILGRMGNAKQALAVIINKLEDMEEAVEFVTVQHDDDLWEELIKQCLRKPDMIGMLLEHTVGNLDPLYIVKKVPDGLEIPRLRDRLVKIVTDYRTETSLRHGCNDILKTDCVNLLIKYYKEARRAVYLGIEEEAVRRKREDDAASPKADRAANGVKHMVVKSKTRGGGRCCLCFDPFYIQNISVVVFFCCHGYHISCLTGASGAMVGANNRSDSDDNDSENEDNKSSGSPRMRCVLCTTAGR
ncbi:vacuolar protein sorting-associated protein 41 homolog [Zingiber officinale]|uniref:vacuolar protein sorting-associated protein 41 homolog n=1 Tax=Zingiber officinale TaxID=94328 RepID=UPI001C4B5174|nr:vacuolar protein sorting-associated protein 41 homolog [Zingiber officinale]XP_042448786.1 vacuolar protein sorting-associated protein 41 homolog [Zingiber officinale]XP_042448787.1 vacuolar protein sorting-associated protein 41 homolog [Zingiber officinale]